MLIKFLFENFLSFKKTAIIDLEAVSIRELPENTYSVTTTSIPFKILKSAAIYGANASGKSNILKAFLFFRNFLLLQTSRLQNVKLAPYKLDPEYETKPSLFEVTILIENTKYRYGFALSEKMILSEWLYATEKRKEEIVFKRDGQEFQIDKRLKQESDGAIQMLTKIIKPDVLFLSHLGNFKSATAQSILDWVQKSILILDSNSQQLLNYTATLLETTFYKRRITDIVHASDLGFSSVEPEVKEMASKTGYDAGFIAALFEADLKEYRIRTRHSKHSHQKLSGYTFFDLRENESLGSQKFVMLLGPLLKVLKDGGIIWIDELDSRIHTNLLLAILRFFNSALNNPIGAQLIYTAHNTAILEKDLRRDQMIFVKRTQHDGSVLTTLHNWDNKIRSDASFDKDYLKGKYSAVPKIDLSPDLFDE